MRRISAGLVAVCVSLALAACGPDAGSAAEVYRADFDEMKERFKGCESAMAVLEDYEITEAEIIQLQGDFETCMHDQGYSIITFDDMWGSIGVREVAGENPDALDQSKTYCDETTGYGLIAMLYNQTTTNPKKLPYSQVLFDCLKRFDVLDPAVTLKEFQQEEEDFNASRSQQSGVSAQTPADAHRYVVGQEEARKVYYQCSYDTSSVPEGR